MKVLKEYEKSEDGMNSYVCSHLACGGEVKEEEGKQPPPFNMARARHMDNTDRQQEERNNDGILQVMQRQNMITEMLVKQQKQAHLPVKNVTVFKGDPLTYRPFMRAFEQAIEQKTDNDQDNLYYLQQYTAGEPQELVRSCEHMLPHRGFKEAKHPCTERKHSHSTTSGKMAISECTCHILTLKSAFSLEPTTQKQWSHGT